MIEISKHILEEAYGLLTKQVALPAQIITAPHFYIGNIDDQSIQAFSTLRHEGKDYKIGCKKSD
jgi:hypothetical protein